MQPPHPRAADEWLRRVEAEYTSAAVTQHLVLWLLQLGASPDLVRDGLRIVDDELSHAELSQAVAQAAGSQARPALVQERLGLTRVPTRPLHEDVARCAVDVFCLGETVAVPLFSAMRGPCTVPAAREALERIVRDEVRHRDFGWSLLDWLLQTYGEPMRAFVVSQLPTMIDRVRRNYGQADVPARVGEPVVEDEAWGLLPSPRYAEILARCIERDYRPRFARVGIDLDAALAERP